MVPSGKEVFGSALKHRFGCSEPYGSMVQGLIHFTAPQADGSVIDEQ